MTHGESDAASPNQLAISRPSGTDHAVKDAARQLRKVLGISQDFDDWPLETLILKAVDHIIATQPTASNAGERELDLYDEIECDLPSLFGRASLEGHESGQRLAHQVRTKMQAARSALASKPVAPPAREALSFNCSNGCGACGVKLVDFVTHSTQAQDSDQWVTVASEPQIVSTCCGSAVEVWDERKQDIVGEVSATTPAPAEQTDTARIDWLEQIGTASLQRMRRTDPKAPKYWDIEYGFDEVCASGPSLREAIDAARAARGDEVNQK